MRLRLVIPKGDWS